MTNFRFSLGAAVMLASSFEVFCAQERNRDRAEEESTRLAPGAATIFEYCGPTERGKVIALTEHAEGPPQYLVRYRDGANCQREEWFFEGALIDDPDSVAAVAARAEGNGERASPKVSPAPEPAASVLSVEHENGGRSITVMQNAPDGSGSTVIIPLN